MISGGYKFTVSAPNFHPLFVSTFKRFTRALPRFTVFQYQTVHVLVYSFNFEVLNLMRTKPSIVRVEGETGLYDFMI